MMTPLHADGFEQVALCRDEETGLRSVVVIHDTTLGPALGGVRMHAYPDEDAAVVDGLRLAEAMTLKAAAAGLGLGGRTPSRRGTAPGSSHRRRRRPWHAMCWRPAGWAAS